MATRAMSQIYQLKISLLGIKPSIWRRVLVPSSFTFDQLHTCIQDAMGWEGYHLYGFLIPDSGKVTATSSVYQTPGIQIDDESELDPEQIRLMQYFNKPKQQILYNYDFGDDWMHKVELEEITEPVSKQKYPVLLAGEQACPPEDCGGPHAYKHMLTVLKNPQHAAYDEALELAGDDFNPDEFDPKKVKFSFSKKVLA